MHDEGGVHGLAEVGPGQRTLHQKLPNHERRCGLHASLRRLLNVVLNEHLDGARHAALFVGGHVELEFTRIAFEQRIDVAHALHGIEARKDGVGIGPELALHAGAGGGFGLCAGVRVNGLERQMQISESHLARLHVVPAEVDHGLVVPALAVGALEVADHHHPHGAVGAKQSALIGAVHERGLAQGVERRRR